MKILGVSGSPRQVGNSDLLLTAMLKAAAESGTATEAVYLRDYRFQTCSGCEKCRKAKRCTGLQDDMQMLYPKVAAASGLVLITPIHHYNMTALMKAFIDRMYCYYDFGRERPGSWSSRLSGQRRQVIIAAVGEQSSLEEGGMDLTMETLRRSVTALGYEITGELPVLGVFGKGRVKSQASILERAADLGQRLAQSLR